MLLNATPCGLLIDSSSVCIARAGLYPLYSVCIRNLVIAVYGESSLAEVLRPRLSGALWDFRIMWDTTKKVV